MFLAVFSMRNPETFNRFSAEKIETLFGEHFNTIYFHEDPADKRVPAYLLHFILERK